MTEEQAKQKWCPMVRFNLNITNDHIGEDGKPDGACIGSACMMWRETMPETGIGTEADWKIIPAHGHCGLAGKP